MGALFNNSRFLYPTQNELWVESVKIQVSVIDVGGKTYGLLYVILSKKTLVHVDKTYNQSSKCSHLIPSC